MNVPNTPLEDLIYVKESDGYWDVWYRTGGEEDDLLSTGWMSRFAAEASRLDWLNHAFTSDRNFIDR